MTDSSKQMFSWPIRVYYEDTDAGGVVYHTNYVKFMERARTEWLRGLGFEQDELREKEGVLFAVRSIDVHYLLPAKFNDELKVTNKVIKKGKASINLEQEVMRDTTVLCTANIKVATLDEKTFKPKAMPNSLYALMQ